MIKSVGLHRLRAVQHVVLMAQFVRDILEGLRQIRRLEREECLASRLLREVFQILSPSVSMRVILVEIV